MITDSNQACFVKMTVRGLQEEIAIPLDNVCLVKSRLPQAKGERSIRLLPFLLRLAVKKKITLKEVFEEARKEALTFLEKSKTRHRPR